MEKGELIGEHLRQRRRTMQLAGGVIAMLAILTALAITAGIIAYGQKNAAVRADHTAIRERNRAITNQVDLQADQLTASDPSLAARLDAVASQFGRTPGSEAQLLATSGDDTVWLWDLSLDDAVQRICATTSNTLEPAQWDQYVSPQLPYASPCDHPHRYGLLTP